jgi:hypothetical protein
METGYFETGDLCQESDGGSCHEFCANDFAREITDPVFHELSNDLICQGIGTEESWLQFYDPDTWNLSNDALIERKMSDDCYSVDSEAYLKSRAYVPLSETSSNSPLFSSLNIMNIPNDLLFDMISYLDTTSIQNVICSNKSWRNRVFRWSYACLPSKTLSITILKSGNHDKCCPRMSMNAI